MRMKKPAWVGWWRYRQAREVQLLKDLPGVMSTPICRGSFGMRTLHSRLLWQSSIHRDNVEHVQATLHCQMQGDLADVGFRILTTLGAEKWIRFKALPVCDEAGILIRVVGVSETERPRSAMKRDWWKPVAKRSWPIWRRAAFWLT